MAGPIFHLLCSGALLLDRGTSVNRQGEKGPPQSQHSWTQSGCGEELERLRGGREQRSLFSEGLELLPEQAGVGVGLSVKGWSRRVSSVDRRVSSVDSSKRIQSGQT